MDETTSSDPATPPAPTLKQRIVDLLKVAPKTEIEIRRLLIPVDGLVAARTVGEIQTECAMLVTNREAKRLPDGRIELATEPAQPDPAA